MNLAVKGALQEGGWERENAICKIASAKAMSDPRFRPVTLELKNKGIGYWTIVGCDTYDLTVTSTSDNGKAREKRDVTIGCNFVDFIEHPDYEGLMINIPATERNMNVLASHLMDDRWTIHQQDVLEEAKRRAQDLVASRDAIREAAQPDMMGHMESKESLLQRKLDEAMQKLKELEQIKATVTTVENIPVNPPSITIPDVVDEPKPEKPLTKSEIKRRIMTLPKKFRFKMKKKSKEIVWSQPEVRERMQYIMENINKKYYFTNEYKKEILPLVLKVEQELCLKELQKKAA